MKLPQKQILNQLKNFLKIVDADEIEFNLNLNSNFPFRIKQKRDWVLMSPRFEFFDNSPEMTLVGYEPFRIDGYSLEFPTKAVEDHLYSVIGLKNNKRHLINTRSENKDPEISEIWFDEIVPVIKTASNNYYDQELEELTVATYQYAAYVALKRGELWALGLHYNHQLYQLSGFYFKSIDALPVSSLDNYAVSWLENNIAFQYDVELLKQTNNNLQKHPELEIVEPLWKTEEGKQIFKTKEHSSKHPWSIMVEKPHESHLVYPTKVDKIETNQNIILVEKDNKLGFYNKELTASLPCEYDEIEVIFLDYTYGCALKKDHQWELYDYKSAEKLVASSAGSIDELLEMLFDNR